MTKGKMTVLAVFLAAAGCAGHKAVKPGNGPGSGSSSGIESSGVGQGGVAGQALPFASFQHTVHFAFNSSTVDGVNKKIVKENANYMLAHPNKHVRLEGNTDERGTEEYNLALGWRRARTVKSMMEVLGVPANRMSTISYGKDRPVAMGHNRAAWAKNRRVDFDYKH
ncbi:MAG: peptidoglycan-associated lipoprotein Pal [Acidiferrobacteraceae bacterium]